MLLIEFVCKRKILEDEIAKDSGWFKKSDKTVEQLILEYVTWCRSFVLQHVDSVDEFFLSYGASRIDSACKSGMSYSMNLIEFKDSDSPIRKKIIEDWLSTHGANPANNPSVLVKVNDLASFETIMEPMLMESANWKGEIAVLSKTSEGAIKVSEYTHPDGKLAGSIIGSTDLDFKEKVANRSLLSELEPLNFFDASKISEATGGQNTVPKPEKTTKQKTKEPTPTEKTSASTYNVYMTDSGRNKVQVIKDIRLMLNTGLKESKDIVDGGSYTLLRGVSEEEAKQAQQTLQKAGATIRIDPVSGGTSSASSRSGGSAKEFVYLAMVNLPPSILTAKGGFDEENNSNVSELAVEVMNHFVECANIRLGPDIDCYLLPTPSHIGDEEPVLLNPNGSESIPQEVQEEITDSMYEQSLGVFLESYDEESGNFRIALLSNSLEHWDYDFLKLSSAFSDSPLGEQGRLVIFGRHHEAPEFICQSYDDGELDSGVIAEDSFDEYDHEGAFEGWGLGPDLFEPDFYNA